MKTVVLLCLALLALLTGCVSFNTNVDRAAIPAFTRLLVVSKLPVERVQYLNRFLASFPPQYEICVVDAGPLALPSPDTLVRRQVDRCKSQVMLTIAPYDRYTTGAGRGISSTARIFLDMTDLATQKPFWKAIAQTDGDSPNAYEVVSQLRKDRIITGKIPEPAQFY